MRKNAFTLIEMMVVVAIIGLLTATAVLGFGRQRATARETRRIQDVSSINDALQQHIALGGTTPNSPGWSAVNSGPLNFLVTDGLLNSIPNEQNPAAHIDGQPWCDNYVFWYDPAVTVGINWGVWFKGVPIGPNTYLVAFAGEFVGSPRPQSIHPLNNNVFSFDAKNWCNWSRVFEWVSGSSK